MAKSKEWKPSKGRVLVRFDTNTRPHKSPKDYTRKFKHKKGWGEHEKENNRI